MMPSTVGTLDSRIVFDSALVLDELESMAIAAKGWEILLTSSMSQMPPGHNGPYFDVETPIRNTAHWLTFFRSCMGRQPNPTTRHRPTGCMRIWHHRALRKTAPPTRTGKTRKGLV